MKWESAITEYNATATEALQNDVKRAIVFQMAPAELKVHMQINAAALRQYAQVREVILAFLKAKTLWGQTSSSGDGVVPMEIGAFEKGKGKGKEKGKDGKVKGKGKDKGK